jgi:hypothetical protein
MLCCVVCGFESVRRDKRDDALAVAFFASFFFLPLSQGLALLFSNPF